MSESLPKSKAPRLTGWFKLPTFHAMELSLFSSWETWKPISLDLTNPKVCPVQSEHNLPDSKVNASLEAEFQAHVSRNLTFFQPSKRREASGSSVAQN